MNTWQSSKYAGDLASLQGGYNPKTKFLFKVKFELTPDAVATAASLEGTYADEISDLTFLVKQIDLPKLVYDYEEANYYNFKTKVLKSIKYGDLGFTFYDDVGNRALNFFNMVLMLLMPVTRMEGSAESQPEDKGFQMLELLNQSSSNRAFFQKSHDLLSRITIEQFYFHTGSQHLNRYIFTHPRINSFDVDGQDHEIGSIPGFINARFEFDALHIETALPASDSVIKRFSHSDLLEEDSQVNASQEGNYRSSEATRFMLPLSGPKPPKLPTIISGDFTKLSSLTAYDRDNFSTIKAEGGLNSIKTSPKLFSSLLENDPTANLGTMFTGAKNANGGPFTLSTKSFSSPKAGLGAPDGFDSPGSFFGIKTADFDINSQVLAPLARSAQQTLRNEITKARNKPIMALQRAISKATGGKYVPYEVTNNIIRGAMDNINLNIPKQPDFLTDNSALSTSIKNLAKRPPKTPNGG